MSRRRIVPLDQLGSTYSRWDAATEILLAGLLAFMPFALGAVEAWSRLIVVAAAGLLATLLVLRLAFDGGFRPLVSWAYVPLTLWVLLPAWQLIDWPPAVLAAISPSTADTRGQLLNVNDASGAISLYPSATAGSLRMALVFGVIWLAAVNAFADKPHVKRLLKWILIVAAAQAGLALIQVFIGADRIYGVLEVPGRVTSGSFINYSHFSQFMNLSIGAGLALLLVTLQEDARADRRRGVVEPALAAWRLRDHGWLFAALALAAVAVCTSMSRNGVISMMVAALVTGTALYARGILSQRGWLLGLVPAVVLAALLAFTFDAVYERLATLQDDRYVADRWELTQAVLSAWRHYPVWGVGLGAHEFVFPGFDTTGVTALAAHADNDYAQLLEEAGVVGTAAVAAFIGLILYRLIGLCRRGKTSAAAAAFGLLFGLVAVGVHSASDFGQRLPAVFALTAILTGLALRLGRLEAEGTGRIGEAPAWYESTGKRWTAAVLSLTLVVGAFGWAVHGAWAAYRGEAWRGVALALESELAEAPPETSPEQADQLYSDLIAASEQAALADPQNVVYGFWLNDYRWRAVSQAVDPETGEVLLPREALPAVEQIANDLARVRRLCPTFGPAYALEGQLRLLVLGDESGRRLVELGVDLAPYDPEAAMTAAEIAALEGRTEDAVTLVTHAVQLQPQLFPQAAAMLLELDRHEDAEALALGDYGRLKQLAELAAADEQHTDRAAEWRAAAIEALRAQVSRGEESPATIATLAGIDAAEGRIEQAIELYRRALAADYRQVPWRVQLAKALIAAGRTDEARHEVEVCLRLRPGYGPAKELAQSLAK